MVQQGAEIQEGTAVHAAWYKTTKAMHRSNGGPWRLQEVGAAAVEPAVMVQPPLQVVQLRPFRAHAITRTAAVEFCIRCFAKAPGTSWRSGGRSVATARPRLGHALGVCWPMCTCLGPFCRQGTRCEARKLQGRPKASGTD
jgi:hypothetical protein